MKIGYARVSREDQNLERQITALQNEGCERIFSEKLSGSYKHRPELDKMISILVPGDVVVVQKLDRLGRSLKHLLSLVEMFKEKGIDFKSLGDSFDTNTSVGRFVFQIMGAIAEFEREMIRERTKDGLKQAKLNGKVLGPPRKDRSAELLRFAELGGDKKAVMADMGISEYKYYELRKRMKAERAN